jgi:hypothetical protein
MPVNSINNDRSWKTSQIISFLANVALERLSCNDTHSGDKAGDYPHSRQLRADIASGLQGWTRRSMFYQHIHQVYRRYVSELYDSTRIVY